MKTIAITIEEGMLSRIDELGKKDRSAGNRSKFIRDAIRNHLARIERMNEEQREREIFKRNRAKLHQQAVALIKEQAKP